MSDYPMLISNKLHSFRNFWLQTYKNPLNYGQQTMVILLSALTAFG